MERLLIYFWIYVLPIPLSVTSCALWYQMTENLYFVSYVTLLPLFYGYITPGIATNIFKWWRFRGPGRIGNYYLHHGFMYCANMSPLLWICFIGVPSTHLSFAIAARIVITMAALLGFCLWIHDILLVRHRLVEIVNRPAIEGRSPEEIVTHYAPLCFALMGLAYAGGGLVAYQTFVISSQTSVSNIILTWVAGAVAISLLPGIAYFLLIRKVLKTIN